ncbi:MAG: hypothetical protein SF053_01680 [Bacteroidia bacterium]|jgi:hypothetical protein|nr:hypothetical protein [Bacteroidia bacterium]
MLRHILLISCCCLLLSGVRAGGEPLTGGGRPFALGQAFTGVRSSLWSLYYNPAGITGLEGTAAGAWVENRFFLSPFTTAGIAAAQPLSGNQAAGLHAQSFGGAGYRENSAALTYGITVLDLISIGAQAQYQAISIEGYGNTGMLLGNVGLQVQLNQQVSVGFGGYNVARARITTLSGQEDVPVQLTAGVAYRPTDKVLVVADVQKDVDHPVSFRGGIEYQPQDIFVVRVGTGTQPLALTGGLGLNLSRFTLDGAFSFTQLAGYSTHVSMGFALGKS